MSSNRAVFKYEITVDDQWHEIFMPIPAVDVHVASPPGVRGTVNVWAEVTPSGPELAVRKFRVFGTGQPIPDGAAYTGTALAGPFVWHVYAEAIS